MAKKITKLTTREIDTIRKAAEDLRDIAVTRPALFCTKRSQVKTLVKTAARALRYAMGAGAILAAGYAVASGCTGAAIWTKTISVLGGGKTVMSGVAYLAFVNDDLDLVVDKILEKWNYFLISKELEEFLKSVEFYCDDILSLTGKVLEETRAITLVEQIELYGLCCGLVGIHSRYHRQLPAHVRDGLKGFKDTVTNIFKRHGQKIIG